MTDFTTRPLAEIERREEIANTAGGETERWCPIGTTGVIALDADGDWVHRPLEANVRTAQDFVTANDPAAVLAYLGALRGIVGLHRLGTRSLAPYCLYENEDWPCPTLHIIATALGVEIETP